MSTEARPLVLIATQDQELAAALGSALGQAGLAAQSIATEREVLAALERLPAAALVVDAQLPQMSGFELAREVRRLIGPRQLSLAVLTDAAWSPAQRQAAIQQLELAALWAKPIEIAQLARQLQKLLGTGAVRSESLDAPGAPAPQPAAAPRAAPTELSDRQSRKERFYVEQEVKSAALEEVELRGNLARLPFPELLHALYRRRASGALFLLQGSVKKIVYLCDGQPCYVKSNLLDECLGEVLVREGLISESQCKQSLRKMQDSRRQQGIELIEMGAITPHQLVVGLQLQLQAKLMAIFAWTQGEYFFKAGSKMPAEAARLEVSAATLVSDGIRRHWDQARLAAALDPLLERYPLLTQRPELRFQELGLAEDEQDFRDCADGCRTLRELLAQSSLPVGRALAVAYALVVTGVLEICEEPQPPAEQVLPLDQAPDEDIRYSLVAQLLSLQRRDPYGVLGVSAGAPDNEIRQAYEALARQYHPDGYCGCSREVRQLAESIFALVGQAYAEVSSAAGRAAYQRNLEQALLPAAGEAPSAGSTLLGAEQLRQEGLRLVAAKRWPEAQRCLTAALELCPEAGDLLALRAWSQLQATPADRGALQAAVAELRRAIQLDPGNDQPYLYLGQVYLALGKPILAERQFENAIQCNPDCAEALTALRDQQLRRPARRS